MSFRRTLPKGTGEGLAQDGHSPKSPIANSYREVFCTLKDPSLLASDQSYLKLLRPEVRAKLEGKP